MNTYEDNLRDSLTKSLANIADQQAALRHGQSQAEAALYHAKGAVLASRDRLEANQRHRDERRVVHHAAKRAVDQSTSLRATLDLAKQGSDGAIANTATTAGNLQASADAVMQLAATIGSALNVASAALYDTELFHQITRVNAHLNRIANQSRFLALRGTEMASKCAESIVASLADQGADVQKRLTDLQSQTQASLDEKVAAVAEDEAAMATAKADAFTAHSQLRDVRTRQEAMAAMLSSTRRYANLDLTVEVLSAHRIKLGFKPFKAPFSGGDRGGLPKPNAAHFLAIIPASQADQFTADRATQLFDKWDRTSPIFQAVTPETGAVSIKVDVNGNALAAGKDYVAFLYIEPSLDYKRYLGNFSDGLSIASAPFAPLTPLPGPIFVGTGGNDNRLILAFADEGQAGGGSIGILADLEHGVQRLTPLADWLRRDGATLDADLALQLDAVVPPYASVLSNVITAVTNGDADGARAAANTSRELLNLVREWGEPDDPPLELGELRGLLPLLGKLVDRAADIAGQPDGVGQRLEVRCILIDHALDPELPEPRVKGALPSYFTVDIARQVTPGNYTIAIAQETAPAGLKPPDALKKKNLLWYQVTLNADGQDCFGNPLIAGHAYTPFILAAVRGPAPTEWQDTLTALDHVWLCA